MSSILRDGIQAGDRRVTPALHDLWAYADLIAPPAPEPRWPEDEERRAAGEAERGWVDAALKSRESPAAVAQLALPPRPIRERFTRGLVSIEWDDWSMKDDHQRLTTDPTIYTPSSDGHMFGSLPYRTGIAPTFHRDAIILAQQQQQQSALEMPQTTRTPISMQQQLEKLPSALNVPNDDLHPLATLVLTAPLASPQLSSTLTATNGQTSPVPPRGDQTVTALPSLAGEQDGPHTATG
ncbi:hypothetical protein F5888DRAFT_1800693 [Russula emetica]|nr:hypothetical protein F5888DRAFT_1800693 [Russula emetica]